jgi:excisionase family DNA binding protein
MNSIHKKSETDNQNAQASSSLLSEELFEVLYSLRQSVGPVGHIRPLSIDEAAKALRCRRSEIETLISKGILPVIKRNGRRYLLPGDLQKRLREELEFENTIIGQNQMRKQKRPFAKPKDIDPALKKFFD